jgi:hypothetical protein
LPIFLHDARELAGRRGMQPLKNAFGIIGALVPILYCVGFLIYFANVQYFTGVPVGNALGPTMLGLGAVAILFAIPLVLRVARLFRRTPPPGAGGGTRGGPRGGPSPDEERSDFDPDAAIARYMAQRPASPDPQSGSASAAASPPRPTFGRKAV